MGRVFSTLKCGCLISCDGGGGLYPCDSEDCEAQKYIEEHKMLGGYCKICHSNDYQEELKLYRDIWDLI